MRSVLLVLALSVPAAAVAEPRGADISSLGWMAGCWEARSGAAWTEECWTTPRGGMMLGSSRTGKGDSVTEWETLRIARAVPNGDETTIRLGYFASPGGRPETLFVWSPHPGPGVAFFNLANDYPQRIRYWREGEALVAEIALADGTKAKRWRFRRADRGR